MHEAMGRFCVTPRTNRPRRVLLMRKATPASTASAKATMITRLQGSCRLSMSCTQPLIHAGFSTPTFCAPNTLRTSCCSIRLMPQVASSVSSGRPYRKRITPRSSTAPMRADAMKARHGRDQVPVERTRKVALENALHHIGGIGADHHQHAFFRRVLLLLVLLQLVLW